MTDNYPNYSISFIGHRKVNNTEDIVNKLYVTIENLIVTEKVSNFLFGSKSEFNDICLQVVTELKKIYTIIKRIYVRAEFPYINDDYKNYLLKSYDETYFPEKIISAGRAIYVERNYEMIDNSKFCIFYFDKNQTTPKKSGTKISYDYAIKKNKIIFNVFDI